MDRTPNDLSHLFSQLGLANAEPEISLFIATHTLKADQYIEQADFWNDSQREFLIDARQQDAEWIETIDQLNNLLHK